MSKDPQNSFVRSLVGISKQKGIHRHLLFFLDRLRHWMVRHVCCTRRGLSCRTIWVFVSGYKRYDWLRILGFLRLLLFLVQLRHWMGGHVCLIRRVLSCRTQWIIFSGYMRHDRLRSLGFHGLLLLLNMLSCKISSC